MIYATCFVQKAQINYVWFLKESKVSKFLHVTTFDNLCTSSFDTKCAHNTMEMPKKKACAHEWW